MSAEDFTIKIVNGYSLNSNKTYTEKTLQKDIARAFEIINFNNILYDVNSIKISTELAEGDEYAVIFKFTVTVFDLPEKIQSPRNNRYDPTGVETETDKNYSYVSEEELIADLDDVDMDAVAVRFVIYIMSEQWLSDAGLEPLPERMSDATVEQKICLLENISDRYVKGYTIDDVERLLALGDEDEV